MEYLTLEQRIVATTKEFENDGVDYDIDFVTKQVTAAYPGESVDNSPSGWKVAYHKVYPTKDARDIELGMKQI